MMNVLVLPSGTEIGLEIHEALRLRRDVTLFGAQSTDNSHAAYVFRKNFTVPHYDDPAFLDEVNRLVTEHKIDYIFPAHDDVQIALAQSADRLRCALLSSPYATVAITRFKNATYDRLRGIVPIPHVYNAHEVGASDFPVFVKPDRGQGSQHAVLCRDKAALSAATSNGYGEMLICEYLPGREVTVDCFSDRDAGLLFVGPRERARTRAGISVRSRYLELPEAHEYARAISETFTFHGAWFFQLKERSPGEWVLLEVGARISGGATFTRMLGVNLPLLTIFEHRRLPLEILAHDLELTMDRAFISRFAFRLDFDELCVDFDDTLSIAGTPNFELIALIYAAKHAEKRILLLTRNEGSALAWLEDHALTGVFDEIKMLDRTTPKTSFMTTRSLLIDDSYAERKACTDAGLLSFDVDATGALLDNLLRS
jgi:carbamoyl-phosphate synthase large subunit